MHDCINLRTTRRVALKGPRAACSCDPWFERDDLRLQVERVEQPSLAGIKPQNFGSRSYCDAAAPRRGEKGLRHAAGLDFRPGGATLWWDLRRQIQSSLRTTRSPCFTYVPALPALRHRTCCRFAPPERTSCGGPLPASLARAGSKGRLALPVHVMNWSYARGHSVSVSL